MDRLDRWVSRRASIIQAVAGTSVLAVFTAAAVLSWITEDKSFLLLAPGIFVTAGFWGWWAYHVGDRSEDGDNQG